MRGLHSETARARQWRRRATGEENKTGGKQGSTGTAAVQNGGNRRTKNGHGQRGTSGAADRQRLATNRRLGEREHEQTNNRRRLDAAGMKWRKRLPQCALSRSVQQAAGSSARLHCKGKRRNERGGRVGGKAKHGKEAGRLVAPGAGPRCQKNARSVARAAHHRPNRGGPVPDWAN